MIRVHIKSKEIPIEKRLEILEREVRESKQQLEEAKAEIAGIKKGVVKDGN